MDESSINEQYINTLTELLGKIEKTPVRHLELQVRQEVIDYWWQWASGKNYELAFELYAIQIERLRDVPSEEIPEIVNYYYCCANAYYAFREYAKAIDYYNNAIKAMDDNGSNFFYILHAYNGLGICYAACDDFVRSDSCFNTILLGRFLPEDECAREE